MAETYKVERPVGAGKEELSGCVEILPRVCAVAPAGFRVSTTFLIFCKIQL